MSATTLAEVENQINTFWANMFVPELLEANLLANLCNREYEGDMKAEGDTVRVSQIIRSAGETRTVGVDADSFNSKKMQMRHVDVKANKRFIASHKFTDLAELQSQIRSKESDIRQSLIESVNIEVNNYLYSLIAPASGLTTGSTAALNSSVAKAQRVLAGKQKWDKRKGWYALVSPDYYGDVMSDSTLSSQDFVDDRSVQTGEVFAKRYGFNFAEDNSDGIASLSPSSTKAGLFFHPDFLYFVMQQMPRFKVSDLHSNEEFSYIISVDAVGGGQLGLQGANKHLLVKGDA